MTRANLVRRLNALVVLCLALALSACAAGYRDSDGAYRGGFSEQKISDDVWIISYAGNGYTSHETVQTYWLFRASELTLQMGYAGFGIASEVKLSWRTPNFMPVVDEGLTGKPYMVGRIKMLESPLPDRPGQVFDAQALITFLRPYVEGDKCSGNVCPHVHRYLYPGFNPDTGPAEDAVEI